MWRARAVLVWSVVAAAMLALVPMSAVAAPAPGRLLVTYAEPVDAEVALADAGLVRLASAAGPADLGPSRVQTFDLPDGRLAGEVATTLAADPGVVAVEPDTRLHAQASPWGLENAGQSVRGTPGRVGVDIGVAPAWPVATGRGAVVAVLDTGVDVAHPLLRDRLWTNPAERADGRDTDGNGFVDDLHGWNFAADTANIAPSSRADVHGTHVAGIVAGSFHAASGFRGVAPDARIMVARFIGDDGAGWTSDAVAALRYAAANGADVINASFGGEEFSTALRTAMAELDLPIVTSAGNTGVDHAVTPIYPAAFGLDNQVSVAAVEHTGALADFSATGATTVHVAAPGRAILSTIPGARLAELSGTSMAAPFVAGALALAVEAAPQASTAELIDAVVRGVRPLPGLEATVSGGLARASGTLAALGRSVPLCATEVGHGFQDVGPTHTHRRGVACLAATDVTAGVSATRYGAELGLSRAQVASLVAATLDLAELRPAVPAVGQFTDVEDSVHRDNVEALASVGIVRGVSATRYEPARTVTRGEFAGIVARAAEFAAGAPSRAIGPTFDDIATSAEHEGIVTASALALVNGRAPGVFDPESAVRRDQAATMLVHLLDRLHQQGLAPAA